MNPTNFIAPVSTIAAQRAMIGMPDVMTLRLHQLVNQPGFEKKLEEEILRGIDDPNSEGNRLLAQMSEEEKDEIVQLANKMFGEKSIPAPKPKKALVRKSVQKTVKEVQQESASDIWVQMYTRQMAFFGDMYRYGMAMFENVLPACKDYSQHRKKPGELYKTFLSRIHSHSGIEGEEVCKLLMDEIFFPLTKRFMPLAGRNFVHYAQKYGHELVQNIIPTLRINCKNYLDYHKRRNAEAGSHVMLNLLLCISIFQYVRRIEKRISKITHDVCQINDRNIGDRLGGQITRLTQLLENLCGIKLDLDKEVEPHVESWKEYHKANLSQERYDQLHHSFHTKLQALYVWQLKEQLVDIIDSEKYGQSIAHAQKDINNDYAHFVVVYLRNRPLTYPMLRLCMDIMGGKGNFLAVQIQIRNDVPVVEGGTDDDLYDVALDLVEQPDFPAEDTPLHKGMELLINGTRMVPAESATTRYCRLIRQTIRSLHREGKPLDMNDNFLLAAIPFVAFGQVKYKLLDWLRANGFPEMAKAIQSMKYQDMLKKVNYAHKHMDQRFGKGYFDRCVQELKNNEQV